MIQSPSRKRSFALPRSESQDEPRAAVAQLIEQARCIVALTGAGISTESGIPDFRGPQGLWTKDPQAEKLSDIRYYMSRADIRERAWRARLAHPAWTAQPNGAHFALATIQASKRLSIVTQNVDGLHQRAGSHEDSVIEIHGTVWDVVCMRCGDRGPMESALERVRAGEVDPHCTICGGILKSATISFGQSLDPDVVARAETVSLECDLFLALGTTLAVYPAAILPEVALSRGATFVILNNDPTPMDMMASVVVQGPLGQTLPEIVSRLPLSG